MAKKILLIENDQAFADRLASSLEAAGFEVRPTGDGKEGLELARDWAPAAIVLCVELPGMSGYLVCQKLKKDEALKPIPLVLTSSEATQETFEKHRTLKARADDYLLKPYDSAALVERLVALVGLPEAGEPAGPPALETAEELVSLEEEIGIPPADDPGAEVPALDLEALPDEPSPGAPGGAGDEDLRLLDDAFDGIASPAGAAREAAAALDELAGEQPVAVDEVDAAAASLPDEDEAAGRAALSALDGDDPGALTGLADLDETLSPGLPLRGERPTPRPARVEAQGASSTTPAPAAPAAPTGTASSRPTVRGANADLLRAAGIRLLAEERAQERPPSLVPPPPEPRALGAGASDDGDLASLREELEDARAALERLRADLAARDDEVRGARREAQTLGRKADAAEGELAQVRARAEVALEEARAAGEEARRAADQAREAEAERTELRQRSGELERRAGEAERRAAEAERRATAAEEEARRKAQDSSAATEALARAETLEREADELRTELLVARGEAEGVRGEVEKRTADLRKRVAELEAANTKNEERVVRAYQKIKADEKVRDKVRKALAIATQLLEEGLPSETQAEKERRLASREDRP